MINPDRAAIKATEILIERQISYAPVIPQPILKSMPNVLVLSYAEMSAQTGLKRSNLLTAFGEENQASVVSVKAIDGKLRYVIAFNQRLPQYMIQRALARELGHIVLGHDGSLPEDVRNAEAQIFAYHLLCPRPLIKAVQEAGVAVTAEVLGTMTGCYELCLDGMRVTPGAHVPPELNRQVKSQFADYVENFASYYKTMPNGDRSAPINIGTYMDCYQE